MSKVFKINNSLCYTCMLSVKLVSVKYTPFPILMICIIFLFQTTVLINTNLYYVAGNETVEVDIILNIASKIILLFQKVSRFLWGVLEIKLFY